MPVAPQVLTPHAEKLLDRLAEHGLIEARRQEGYSRKGYRWEYRAK